MASQKQARALYHTCCKQLLFDVRNVLSETDSATADAVRHATSDGIGEWTKVLPDVTTIGTYDDDTIGTMPVLSGDSAVTIQDILQDAGRWAPMVMHHAWLIAAAAFVHANPSYYEKFRAIAEGGQPAAHAAVPAACCASSTFDVYMERLAAAAEANAAFKQEQLETVFDTTFRQDGVISQMAKEITQELNLNDKVANGNVDLKTMMDFSSPNNLFGEVMQKVSSKLHDKLQSGGVKQEDLIQEAMSMMSSLQTTLPNLSQNLFGGDMANFMQSLPARGSTSTHKKRA